MTAAGEGTWGNGLQMNVDYDTANPSSLFNLTVAEMVDQNGSLVPKRVEVFRNLSLYSLDGSYAVAVVNDARTCTPDTRHDRDHQGDLDERDDLGRRPDQPRQRGVQPAS